MEGEVWTDSELAQLRELMGAGVRHRLIADILGRTYCAVVNKAKKSGIKHASPYKNRECSGRWTMEETSILLECHKEGLSAEESARKIPGKSRNAILGKIHRLGLSNTRKHKKPKRPKREARPRVYVRQVRKPRPPKIPKSRTPLSLSELDPPEHMQINLMDRERNQCAWVIGDPKGMDTKCCGRSTWNETSYCDVHYSASIEPKKVKRKKPTFTFKAVA